MGPTGGLSPLPRRFSSVVFNGGLREALRAVTEQYGDCDKSRLFVVDGYADPDATFAIAARAALVPNDERLVQIATLVHRLDTDPTSLVLTEEGWAGEALIWYRFKCRQIARWSGSGNQVFAYLDGLSLWCRLLGSKTSDEEAALDAEIAEAVREEAEVTAAAEAVEVREISESVGLVSALMDSSRCAVVWLRRYPVMVVHCPDWNNSLGLFVRNGEVAEELFAGSWPGEQLCSEEPCSTAWRASRCGPMGDVMTKQAETAPPASNPPQPRTRAYAPQQLHLTSLGVFFGNAACSSECK